MKQQRLRNAWLVLAIAAALTIAVGAAGYRPAKVGAFYSSDGSGGDGTWLPMAGSGGVGAAVGRVQHAGIYYSSDGTGNDGTWLPCPLNCFGSAGGSGTVNSGALNQLAYYAAAGTAVSGTSALPDGITATTQPSTDASTKVATDAFVAAKVPSATEWTNELGSPTSQVVANQTRLWSIWFPVTVTANKITYRVATADNSAALYSLGIYDASGTLVCHVNPTVGTTFAPAAGNDITASWTAPCTVQAGSRYNVGLTGNAGTAVLAGATRRFLPQCTAGAATNNVTSGGALNASITYVADTWSDTCGPVFFSLHN